LKAASVRQADWAAISARWLGWPASLEPGASHSAGPRHSNQALVTRLARESLEPGGWPAKEQHFGMIVLAAASQPVTGQLVSRHVELGGVLELLGFRVIGGADGPRCKPASQSNQADRADEGRLVVSFCAPLCGRCRVGEAGCELLHTAVGPLQSRGGWL
jgi:hypothetical protein